jgi:RNA polymerase sigma-70 factor (ECF subfamily)
MARAAHSSAMLFKRKTTLTDLLPRMRRLAVALCRDRTAADDLVQDTIVRALAKQDRFDGANLPAWLSTLMINLFRNDRRRFARLPMLVDLEQAGETRAHDSDAGLGQDIRRALSTLPEEQRIAILLLALEGHSYKEIADMQNVPIGTIMSRIARARESLRVALETPNDRIAILQRPDESLRDRHK